MKPNLLFILSDDQSYFAQHRECGDIITPALDALADSGAYFENCFCASPVCSPARASILTGTMPSYHGVHDWISSGSVDIDSLPVFSRERPPIKNNESIAIDYLNGVTSYTDILADNGYDIALSGKWHLGDTMRRRKGYTYWNTILRGGCSYRSYDMYRDGLVTARTEYLTHAIADNAIDYLRNYRTDKPFYLGVHFTAPHTPWLREEHPEEIWRLYEGADFEGIPCAPIHKNQMCNDFIGDTPEKRLLNIRGYFTAVTAMDAEIGRILASLSELGLDENTVVIFTSDNGMNVGQHGVWGKGNGTYPQNFYEESIKVPLIVKIPGERARVIDDLVSHTDIFPTILDVCGIGGAPDCLCGASFLCALKGEKFERDHVSVCSEYGAVRMIRDRRYKYIQNHIDGDDIFYDLMADSGETSNLIRAEAYLPEIERMKALMDEDFNRFSSFEHDGRFQFPEGMGQLSKCSRADGRSAYKRNRRMYYDENL